MAKSLRSKWKRKMRAKKRERYAVKELARLKTVVESAKKTDVDMSDICQVVTIKQITQRRSRKEASEVEHEANDDETGEERSEDKTEEATGAMEVDVQKKKYDRRTMKDKDGQYPVWMNQREIHRIKARLGKGTRKGKRKQTW
ncbi:protein LLP homolog [Ornithodoros turicata]|uniref:Uncharacterized protein n=1 Tax=Ornithodoros turicata TaxID=34597 RepID=A0A2R5LFJ8_9ACAR